MITAWLILISYYITTFPEQVEMIRFREKFACEIILNDEGFFEQDILMELPVMNVSRIYKFAELGAKFLAWQSFISGEEDWTTFLIRKIYKTNGLCDQANHYARHTFMQRRIK